MIHEWSIVLVIDACHFQCQLCLGKRSFCYEIDYALRWESFLFTFFDLSMFYGPGKKRGCRGLMSISQRQGS